MNDYNIDPAGIKSMNDLKQARIQTRMIIEMKEMEIRHDIDSIKDRFSWAHIMGSIATKAVVWPGVIRNFRDGYQFARSMVSNFKNRSRKKEQFQRESREKHCCG